MKNNKNQSKLTKRDLELRIEILEIEMVDLRSRLYKKSKILKIRDSISKANTRENWVLVGSTVLLCCSFGFLGYWLAFM